MSGDVLPRPGHAPAATGRVAPWVLVVTGTGMRGAAEDRLRERAARIYGPVVPVVIHRYGVLRSGALLRWCQRIAARRLGARLRQLVQEHGRPDVVAHSFGGWLVGEVLTNDADLRVGRIVLAGSVLRPDFDWATLIAGGRVEAVLNHYSRSDFWAWLSQFFIPGSGPSGHRGFLSCPGVLNQAEAGFSHTTFFAADAIDDVHHRLWGPYLRSPAQHLAGLAAAQDTGGWRPVPWPLRATVPRALVGVALLAGAAGIVQALLSALRLAGVFPR